MRRILIIIGLIYSSLSCNAQVRQGDIVIMPLEVYRHQRTSIYSALGEVDSLKAEYKKAELECDSIISLQDNRIAGKDSVITNLNHKLDLKNQEIEILNKPESKITIKGLLGFICGGIAGSVWTILILK